MDGLVARIGLAGFVCLQAIQGWAADSFTSTLAGQGTAKAMTIVFEPPKGKEDEFLNDFVSSQTAYMQSYSGRSMDGVKVINLIPTEKGEPLIHLMIYSDSAKFERARQIFDSREGLKGYIDGHVKKYGGYNVPKEYLQNTKVYLSNVLADAP
ncbi:hypothetical protein [Pseudomonas sp. LFM046]|uniref:hypothetical protein n=1 Tax=Pseudomonas sp. LFM046 TaxID=1608357 RepID=UPI0005CFCA34|nr:hypothetical protein [Pseudomonas sp. LFM046]